MPEITPSVPILASPAAQRIRSTEEVTSHSRASPAYTVASDLLLCLYGDVPLAVLPVHPARQRLYCGRHQPVLDAVLRPQSFSLPLHEQVSAVREREESGN